jgi:hypothetical protein
MDGKVERMDIDGMRWIMEDALFGEWGELRYDP